MKTPMAEMEWYPTPSYLVKRRVIVDYLRRFSFRDVLEVGCGCGDLLQLLDRNGYTGLGIDISQKAVAVASAGLVSGRIRALCGSPDVVEQQFSVVIASEVMEHYENDIAFLALLRARLRDAGLLILTVPAHMSDWGPNDDFCGHIRRYEREELKEKLASAGFDSVEVYSYGVPIYNIMKPLYDRAIRSKPAEENQMDKTTGSGGMWIMGGASLLFRVLFNELTMYPLYLLQRLFYNTDLGKGYFVAARKKEPM